MKWYQRLLISIIRSGEIPKSIAIIMDGNRRYAVKLLQKKHQGHKYGLKKLQQVVQWANQLGITQLTLYTFSRDNFKRSEVQIQTLMNLVKSGFARLSQQGQLLQKYKVRVQFLGDLDLFQPEIKEQLIKVQDNTSSNDNLILNICMGYSSIHEITGAMKGAAQSMLCNDERQNYMQYTDNQQNVKELFEQNLHCGTNCSPDLLIRTSGEKRLSNFLLYQSKWSHLCFVQSLWPEFSLWDFVKCIISYQRHAMKNRRLKKEILSQ